MIFNNFIIKQKLSDPDETNKQYMLAYCDLFKGKILALIRWNMQYGILRQYELRNRLQVCQDLKNLLHKFNKKFFIKWDKIFDLLYVW